MKNNYIVLAIIAVLVAFAVSVVIPHGPNYFGKETKIHLGLDLQGGVQLLYKMDTSQLGSISPDQAQTETVDLISRRVDDLGVSEPKVQATRVGSDFDISVELPGIKDIEAAKALIGKTAQLKFYEINSSGQQVQTDLTGSDITSATVGTNTQGSQISGVSPVIYLQFTAEGAKKFAEITKRNIGKPLITMLDSEVINSATVQTEIDGGKAQIEGIGTIKEAKDTTQLINEGALPAPISLIQENQVGATLGRDSIEASLIAGVIGLLLVIMFMIIYYRSLGIVAVVALAIYTTFVIAAFKLIPVTLTLAGIAGFIFSIGAAVDANILTFERFKEEKKKGIPMRQALENGFNRSWPSIRDSNIASLITAAILYEFFSSGLVRGFAVTLAIGIFISMFTAIVVTRSILRLVIKNEYN
jgi:preprotein translocase subunit SecD